MKFAMITFAAAMGSASAYSTDQGTVYLVDGEYSNKCMRDCGVLYMGQTYDDAEEDCYNACPGGVNYVATAPTSCFHSDCNDWDCDKWCTCYSDTYAAQYIYRNLGCDSKCMDACPTPPPTPAPTFHVCKLYIDQLETANAALATATTCMAATPGYSPVNFEDNCDMKQCDQWTCETWCTCYSEADAAIYTRLGCDTVDDVPCQC